VIVADIEIQNVGYRLADNEIRWPLIRRELLRDGLEDANPLCLEIGSNFGYFSLNIANAYPNGRIFSVEGSFGTGNDGGKDRKASPEIRRTPGIQTHAAIRDRLNLSNDTICLGVADASTFKSIIAREILFDYQVSLSVFHWIVDASAPLQLPAGEILADHLRIAKTTFIELPAMSQGKPLPSIYRDYATIPQAVSESCKRHGLNVRITYLGSCPWYGTRDTYRIDVENGDRGYYGHSGHSTEAVVEALSVQAI
jgi:hypothetical protein